MDVEESVFDPRNGGAIVDSGSSFTYLVEPAFNALMAAVSHLWGLPPWPAVPQVVGNAGPALWPNRRAATEQRACGAADPR